MKKKLNLRNLNMNATVYIIFTLSTNTKWQFLNMESVRNNATYYHHFMTVFTQKVQVFKIFSYL